MGCFVCAKHRDPGLDLVGADELVVVTHVSPDAPGSDGAPVYLGHLVVEPRRHVAGLDGLADDEAAAVGRWVARAGRALRAAGAEHVYSAVIGHHVDHLHQHLIPRYPGTPREYWWLRMEEWPQARLGDAAEVANVVRDLRARLGDQGR
ncbi:MAG: HIT domain-containing protein [Actinophytocola sp.]|uniref:HIT family protein n=1 Tax=Actinophytocola sp. TaxID=1872138 RepID=UPI00132545B8|nr:HIT domain-containing protein [Actinophytocola sp.]MPZ84091.1 HIT domain-containing protein [Actinophytocola sp.]